MCYRHILLLLCCFRQIGDAQISQDHPALCGSAEFAQLPNGISIVTTAGQGTSVLSMTDPKSTVQLPGVQDEIRQVCSIPDNRLLIFGWAAGSYNVIIVDRLHGTVEDSFYAFDPTTSPDRHWIVIRAFYPPQSQVTFSEEYQLYDLSKAPDGNRMTPPASQAATGSGRLIYPSLPSGVPVERTNLPEEQTHSFCSESFYWSMDSRFVVFGDCRNGLFSLVLVDTRLGETQVRPFKPSELCERAAMKGNQGSEVKLSDASFQAARGEHRSIRVRLSSNQSSCSRDLVLDTADFTRAAVEPRAARHRVPAVLRPE